MAVVTSHTNQQFEIFVSVICSAPLALVLQILPRVNNGIIVIIIVTSASQLFIVEIHEGKRGKKRTVELNSLFHVTLSEPVRLIQIDIYMCEIFCR